MTSFSVSGVVGGERGCGQEIFYLHFGDSFLLDHRQEELHFKLSRALFKVKGMKLKTA